MHPRSQAYSCILLAGIWVVLVGIYALRHPISVDKAFISATSDTDGDSVSEKGKLMPEVSVPVRTGNIQCSQLATK